MSTTNFWKNNFTKFHIIGILLGMILISVYWYFEGQFQESIFKRNIIVANLMGAALGYITIDLVLGAWKRRNNGE